MRIIDFEGIAQRTARARMIAIDRVEAMRTLALALVVALAAGLRIANLSALGYANHYYAAAVEAMLQSWHNFFFVAAEPGGSVSVDKPPVGFWLQAISAKIFGVNTVGLLLPEIVCGLLSVMLVYHLVRRSYGTIAGLLAGLVLAITPVVVATDRNNTIDSILIFTLLLAAWAFIKATEQGKLRYLLLGAALVGVGFNVKMLEAYLPLPAFLALYFLGSREGLWRKFGNLTLAGVVLLVVSLSWAVFVDLTPADQRPYVGSSGDNSELSLAFGYNGVERLLGMNGRGSPLSGIVGGILGNGSAQSNPGFPGGAGTVGRQGGRGGNFFPPGPGGNGGAPQRGFGAAPAGGFAGGGFGGFGGTGRAGATRLFTAPLSKEVSWLLPFGILGGLVLAFRTRPRWPISPRHQALVLWGGWLLTAGVFFSVAGFFHEYYLSTMGPPLAALVGIGALQIWGLRDRWPWLSIGLLLAGAMATLVLQFNTASAFVASLPWLPLVLVLLGGGVALLLISRDAKRVAMAGFACVMAALLITPGVWAGLTTANSSANQSLPAAYSGRPSGPPNRGGLNVNQPLLSYLQANTQGTEFLMAVPSSMQGADYVLATGRPVLYLGGFMGQDKVVTPDQLTQLVNEGKLKYIYWNSTGGRGFGGGQQSDITAWVAQHGTPVTGFDTQTRNSGAPDGTSAGSTGIGGIGGFFGGGGNMQVTLYELHP